MGSFVGCNKDSEGHIVNKRRPFPSSVCDVSGWLLEENFSMLFTALWLYTRQVLNSVRRLEERIVT